MAYGFDHDTHAPIVVLWWRGDTSRDEVTACLDELTVLFESWRRPGKVLFDFGEVGGFDSTMRRLLASWRAKHRHLIQDKVGAAGYVFTSKMARGYLTAVDWLRPNRGMNRRFFATREEAVAWLNTQDVA